MLSYFSKEKFRLKISSEYTTFRLSRSIAFPTALKNGSKTKARCTRGFFLYLFLGWVLWFAIWRRVGIQMTPSLAVFLASLLDLKYRTWSILRLGPGMLLSGSKQTKNIKTTLVCSGLKCRNVASFILIKFPHSKMYNPCGLSRNFYFDRSPKLKKGPLFVLCLRQRYFWQNVLIPKLVRSIWFLHFFTFGVIVRTIYFILWLFMLT